ncbi:MAG: hypothetical protein JW866_04150 [Ignavibacteriales bacterium]|nr:hypothetical protein [Ignavibacteriales bacterium]
MYDIQYLLKNSNLPGPRGNLKLLYDFSKNAKEEIIEKCLDYINPDVKNSPEEFVAMCGVLSYSIRNKNNVKEVIPFLKITANHGSWRIREAVAMAIQEIFKVNMKESIQELKGLSGGSELEKRAVVAGLCEPKLLNDKDVNKDILNILLNITKSFSHDNILNKEDESLRKTLGYGWSVVVSKEQEEGKKRFEELFNFKGKHINWIIRENLKKSRMKKMDSEWVEKCLKRIQEEF